MNKRLTKDDFENYWYDNYNGWKFVSFITNFKEGLDLIEKGDLETAISVSEDAYYGSNKSYEQYLIRCLTTEIAQIHGELEDESLVFDADTYLKDSNIEELAKEIAKRKNQHLVTDRNGEIHIFEKTVRYHEIRLTPIERESLISENEIRTLMYYYHNGPKRMEEYLGSDISDDDYEFEGHDLTYMDPEENTECGVFDNFEHFFDVNQEKKIMNENSEIKLVEVAGKVYAFDVAKDWTT